MNDINKISENILQICDVYIDKVQKIQVKTNEKPNCFILPFIFGDKTNYFSENFLKRIKYRYENRLCYEIKSIEEGTSCEKFSSELLELGLKIKDGMSNGIYTNEKIMYIPIIVMLSSKFTSNINKYMDLIISNLKDDYQIKIDVYFLIDNYGKEIIKNKKNAIDNIKNYIDNMYISFEDIYFLGESNFVFLKNRLDVAVDTIESNIFYKVTGKDHNWDISIATLDANKASNVGNDLDCNWISLGYIRFDVCKYLILYYLKEFIETQIGENNGDTIPTDDEIKQVEKEIDNYLNEKYPKDNLIKHIKDIPINVSKIPYIKKEKKKFFDIFNKNKSNAAFSFENIEEKLFDDKDYFLKYIELNVDENIEKFNLKNRITSFNLLNKLDNILENLICSTNITLDDVIGKLNLQKSFLNKTDNLSSFMTEFSNKYLKIKLEKYILNKKIELIENEIKRNKDKKYTDLDICKENKEKTLIIINNLMEKETFNNSHFKEIVDNLIESKIKKIFVDIPLNVEFRDAINSIGEDEFIKSLNGVLDVIDINNLSKEFEDTMSANMDNKYCIKYISGFSDGDITGKPDPIISKNKMYCDYFDAIMSGSTSDIKCE